MIGSNATIPAAHPSLPGGLGQGYDQLVAGHDEMIDAQREVRPHWQSLLRALNQLGTSELARRWEEARHLIRENGVTYNIHGDPRGLDRPWQLDPIPLVINASEASILEAGLIQRARLLEMILADIYGPQHLLRQGQLPWELIFAHPGFLRPCHGLRPPGQRYLHLYAVDLGRTSDGTIWALGDRTETPAGMGYALENRIILSRTLPDVFRDCGVQRLALFFRSMRETLRLMAPHNHDNPRIVLLTPGPSTDNYFEHAYLARYLGHVLAEGADLTVRDNRVYLKLLGGLQPVDVIVRRLDDAMCDPLELRGDSFHGVPGLLQALRAGNVAVANTLGSGILESPALAAFLPSLCRSLLGEDLKISSAPVWWCGETNGLDHVLSNLSRLILRRVSQNHRQHPIVGSHLTTQQREDLRDRICARPADYVGQEPLQLSTAPVLAGQRLEPWSLVLRAFLTAVEGGFAVMPGGLTRVASNAPELLATSLQSGGGSKDTWVLASGPVSTFSLLRGTVQPVELNRGGGDLPSRAADNLFWMGRYAERAEGVVRLFRAILVRLTEWSGLIEVPELPLLLRALTQLTQTFPGFTGVGAEVRLANPETEIRSLLFDRHRPGSLAATFEGLQRVASMVRDRISTDMWRILNSLDLDDWGARGIQRPLTAVLGLLNQMVLTLAAFGGLAAESMTRGAGWRFLDMGRKLERAANILSLIRSTMREKTTAEGPLLEALLEILDSTMTFRRRYLNSVAPAPALDLLLADETNPRSLAFQLVQLAEDIDNLPRAQPTAGRTPEQRVILSMVTAVRLAEVLSLSQLNEQNQRSNLEEFLARLESDLPLLSDAITSSFLSHLQLSRQLASEQPGSRS